MLSSDVMQMETAVLAWFSVLLVQYMKCLLMEKGKTRKNTCRSFGKVLSDLLGNPRFICQVVYQYSGHCNNSE